MPVNTAADLFDRHPQGADDAVIERAARLGFTHGAGLGQAQIGDVLAGGRTLEA